MRTHTDPIQLLFFNDGTEETTPEPVEFVLPSDEELTALDDDALAELLEQATAAFDALYAGPKNQEVNESLGHLADAVEAIKGEQGKRTEATAAAQAEADQLAERVHGPQAQEGEGGEGEGTEGEGQAQEGQEGGEGEGGANGPAGEPAAPSEPQEPAGEPQAVAAAGTQRPARQRQRVRIPALDAIRRNAPDPEVATGDTGRFAITAAADIRGIRAGANLDVNGVGLAMHERARFLSDGQSAPVASFAYESEISLDENASRADQFEAIRAATDPMNRLIDEEGRVAAGGWCLPNDRRFDLFSIEAQDGMIDLPEITVAAGLEWILNGGPSIADVLAVPFVWTEQDDIDALGNPHEDPDDDREKPCARVPCPTWDDDRLHLRGVCITNGNLADKAFPAMSRRYVDLVMAAHAHGWNKSEIDAMILGSTAVPIAAPFGALSAVLGAATLQAADYRDKYAMAEDAVIEAKIPNWFLGMAQNDVRRRFGDQAAGRITRAYIAQQFADAGVALQFVQDFDRLQLDAGGDGFREAWPTNVRMLMYSPGTWLRGNGGTIELAVGKDSVLNRTNDHTVAFTEEARLLAKVGHESRIVNVTDVLPDGQAGGKPIVNGDYAAPIA